MPVDEEGNPAPPKETGQKCEKCGKAMVIKRGRRGPFLACSGYPECRNTRPLQGEKRPEPKETGEKCEKCGAPMLERQGRWGRFLGCSGYPKCRNIKKLPREKEGEEKKTDKAGGKGEPTPGSKDRSGE